MPEPQIALSDRAEAAVLEQIVVRLVTPQEQERWNQLILQHHYLKNAKLAGERLCYVVEYQGQWLALLGWSAAACHIRARDQWIGWNDNQRRARLPLVANNARFCLVHPSGLFFGACWVGLGGEPKLVVSCLRRARRLRLCPHGISARHG